MSADWQQVNWDYSWTRPSLREKNGGPVKRLKRRFSTSFRWIKWSCQRNFFLFPYCFFPFAGMKLGRETNWYVTAEKEIRTSERDLFVYINRVSHKNSSPISVIPRPSFYFNCYSNRARLAIGRGRKFFKTPCKRSATHRTTFKWTDIHNFSFKRCFMLRCLTVDSKLFFRNLFHIGKRIQFNSVNFV